MELDDGRDAAHDDGRPTIERLPAPQPVLGVGAATPVWTWRSRALSAVAGVGAVGVLVGGVTTLASDPLANARLADRFPANTVVYAEVNVRGLIDGVGPLIDAVAPLLDKDDAADDGADLLTRSLEPLGLTSDQLLPWASGRAGVGVVGDDEDLLTGTVGFAGVVDGRDAAALTRFLDDLEARFADVDRVGDGFTVGDLTWLELQPDGAFAESVHLAQAGDDLLVVSDRTVAGALTAVDGARLADDPGFAAVRDGSPPGADVFLAVDGGTVREAYASMFAGAGGVVGLPGLPGLATAWNATVVEISAGELRMTSVATSTGLDPTLTDGDLVLGTLPEDTIAYVRFGGLEAVIEELRPSLGAMFDPFGDGEANAVVEEVVDLAAGLLARDGAVAVAPPTADASWPVDLAVVAIGDDDATPRLRRLAEIAGPTVVVSRGDAGFELVGDNGRVIARDELALFTSRASLADAAPVPSFGDSELRATADALVGGELVLAVDVTAVVDLVAEQVPPLGAEDEDTVERLRRCRPFRTVAGGTTRGDTVTTTEFVLTFGVDPDCRTLSRA